MLQVQTRGELGEALISFTGEETNHLLIALFSENYNKH